MGVAGGVAGQQVGVKAVVPVSSLSESDDEDDGVEEEEEADDEEESEDESEDEDEDDDVVIVVAEKKEEVKEQKEMEEDVSFFDVYTANRSCLKCGKSLVYSSNNPKKSSSSDASFSLHISCSHCSTLHCRGCGSQASKCPKNCTGSKTCGIIHDCCPQVRAIAVFEALSAFDEAYLAEINGGPQTGNAEREYFIKDLVSKPIGSQARRFEAVFVKCMNVLIEVFTSPSTSSHSSAFASQFERSLMPEVIHLYLENTNVKDWITHSDVYAVILDLLRYMFEAGFGEDVMDVELRKVGESKGVREWLLAGRGEMVGWVVRGGDEKAMKENGDMSRGMLKGGAEKAVDGAPAHVETSVVVIETNDKEEMVKEYIATMEPLKTLIIGLETHRTSLLEVLDRVTFVPTVEKLNVLCDGISQLVLGQVLGI